MNPQLNEAVTLVWKAVNAADYKDTTKRQYGSMLDVLADEISKIEKTKVCTNAKTAIDLINKGEGLRRRCLHLITQALERGDVDLSSNVGRQLQMPQSSEYLQILQDYVRYLREEGHAESSIRVEYCLARKYLVFLETAGCHSTGDATADTIFSFVVSLREGWQATSIGSALSVFRPFIRFLEREDLIYAAESIRAPRKRAILEVLTQEERIAAQELLKDGENITARDRAIASLGLHTGIRACDIVALKIGDINWSGSLSFIQQKTQNSLVLPLTASIGNSLYDYITNERPASLSPHVFLRSRAPHCELKNSSAVYNTIRKVLMAAGVDVEGRQCGSRFLRHSVASAMIANGTTLSTIAAVLGHAAQSSTDTYISVDANTLMGCTLPVVGRSA
jgi:site-specific recombinase XerD